MAHLVTRFPASFGHLWTFPVWSWAKVYLHLQLHSIISKGSYTAPTNLGHQHCSSWSSFFMSHLVTRLPALFGHLWTSLVWSRAKVYLHLQLHSIISKGSYTTPTNLGHQHCSCWSPFFAAHLVTCFPASFGHLWTSPMWSMAKHIFTLIRILPYLKA